MKKVDWHLGSGLFIKGTLTGGSFTVSRNKPALGRTISPESARPQISKHQKHMVIECEPPNFVLFQGWFWLFGVT